MEKLGLYLGPQLGRSLAVVGAAGALGAITGFLRADVDQMVMDLAVQRDLILLGHHSRAALFDGQGVFQGTVDTITAKQYQEQQLGHPDWTSIGIWGGAPLEQIWPSATDAQGNPIEVGEQAVSLAKAIDGLLIRIGRSETANAAPSGTPAISQNVIAPVVVAIVVAGVAASVIGGTYVWRRFAPEVQRDLAAIRAASDAYLARVEIYKSTGKMPPAGPIEAATSKLVSESASTAAKRDLLVGGLAVGGTAVAVTAAALVMRRRKGGG